MTRTPAMRLLSGSTVSRCVTTLTRTRLRILGYHGVPSAAAFQRHLAHLVERFRPVSGAQVQAAALGKAPLPSRAVWVTFDDGDPTVVTVALPLLARYGVPATMFLCPGVVDTATPYWWQVLQAAQRLDLPLDELGLPAEHTEGALKQLPDGERRRVIDHLTSAIEERTGAAPTQQQLTSEQLTTWTAAGHEVGNHSWDHPLLDRCTDDQQREQIRTAHDWLSERVGSAPTTFAYPNGNWSATSEHELRRLGYRVAVGFDHRLTRTDVDPLRLSRLRVDADAALPRYRSILSGAHSGLLAGYRRLRDDTWATDPRRLPT